jgi:predicted PurR-regulated permease PerM
VNRLRRGPFTRGSGVLVVYTLIILAIGIPVYAVAPSLVSQAASFGDTLPERLQSLRPYAENLQPRPLQGAAVSALDNAIQAVQSPQRPAQDQIVQAGATAAHTPSPSPATRWSSSRSKVTSWSRA